ncbi:DNA polymerase III subunit beta [Aerococcus urinaehominis]|uniref:Beta sliding clamp n=1 Tax=Aerococcus urinaehominis TaxID=128944 RepID=A0A120IAW3_9LACT|nr:DNA polymerase III subunit beta [Aerococcus urinaehominis]AMB99338.1 DNA polymerase III subunit beta [Aerococcus urinaehominis]SDM58721.1 DNA polymerase III, beta subunit [Aerococcus urinaehominis]
MKFSIKRSVFIQNLVDVQRAISSRSTIPVLTGVKISAHEEGLTLTGSDATISIEAFIPLADDNNQLKIENQGAIVLPSRFFGEIVKKLPSDTMYFEVKPNLQTEIRSENAEFTLNGTNADEYPRLPEINNEKSFSIPSELFSQLINHTIISVSQQETRPIFTGIHFTIGNGKMKAVSTDSHRLSQRIVPLSATENQDEISVTIPGRSLNELIRIIDSQQDIEMMLTDNQVLFKSGNIYVYSRLLEGQYPDTDRLLPHQHTTSLTIAANEFTAAVERALILSHEGKNNVVKLAIEPERVMLSGQSAEIGNVEEELNIVKATGDALNISFNPDYLKAALRTFASQDVVINFQSPGHPFIILPADHEDDFKMVQLITPIRTPGV